MFRMPISLVLKRIEQADPEEINEIITSLLRYSHKTYQNHELVVISLPKRGVEERCREIDRIAACLKKEYTGK